MSDLLVTKVPLGLLAQKAMLVRQASTDPPVRMARLDLVVRMANKVLLGSKVSPGPWDPAESEANEVLLVRRAQMVNLVTTVPRVCLVLMAQPDHLAQLVKPERPEKLVKRATKALWVPLVCLAWMAFEVLKAFVDPLGLLEYRKS